VKPIREWTDEELRQVRSFSDAWLAWPLAREVLRLRTSEEAARTGEGYERDRAEKAEAELSELAADYLSREVALEDCYNAMLVEKARRATAEAELSRQRPVIDVALTWLLLAALDAHENEEPRT
jgi:hypothetical protein